MASRSQIYDTNFLTLETAPAILQGDLPGRDFFEPGYPIPTVLTALSQAAVGYRLLGEFLLDASFIAFAAALTYVLASRVAQSAPIGAAVTALSIAIYPDFYQYPKLVVYPLMIWLCWRYLDRPTRTRAVQLGLGAALTFLFRHDHAINVAPALPLTVFLAHRRQGFAPFLRRCALCVAAGSLALLPYLAYVQLTEGLAAYARSRLALRGEVGMADGLLFPRFTFNWTAPLARLDVTPPHLTIALPSPPHPPPPPPRPPGPRIGIVWRHDLTPAQLVRLEERIGLSRNDDERTERGHIRYVLTDTSPDNLRGLARERRVVDFDNFGRDDARVREHESESERLDDTPAWPSWLAWPSVDLQPGTLGVEIAPGVFHRRNALAWVYYLEVLLPPVAFTVLVTAVVRHRLGRGPLPRGAPEALVAAVIAALANRGLLRELGYVTTVAGPAAVVGAWLLAQALFAVDRPPSKVARRLAVGILAVTVAFAATVLNPSLLAAETGIRDGPTGARNKLKALISDLLASPPVDGFVPVHEAHPVDHEFFRYVYECTRPDDRVFRMGGTAYHLLYYGERRIAGGHTWHHTGWRSSPEEQRYDLNLLRNQSVPLVYVRSYREMRGPGHQALVALRSYAGDYSEIYEYILEHYVPVSRPDLPVLLDRRREPSGTYARLGLPCFR